MIDFYIWPGSLRIYLEIRYGHFDLESSTSRIFWEGNRRQSEVSFQKMT